MPVWDEQVPGMSGGSTPGMPNIQDLMKILSLGAGKGMSPGAPQAPGSPPVVGSAPPQLAGPSGGLALPTQNNAMSPAQVGGPAARPQNRGYEGPYEFRSPQARTGAVVDSAIKSLASVAQNAKQKSFESEAASAQVIALAQIAKQKQQAGQQLTAQDMQAIEASAKLEKKAPKLIEKAMTDPMSGAYVGVQRAYASYQQQEAQKASLEGQQQQTALSAATAKKEEAMAKFYEQYKGQIEQQKIASKDTEAQNKLIAQESNKGKKVTFDENGQAKITPYTQSEIDADPILKSQQAKELAYTKAASARVKQGDLRLQLEAARLNETKRYHDVESNFKKQALDMKAAGKDKYNSAELKTISLATMGKGYVDEMKQIVESRPDLFGPAGWGDNAYNVALGQKDKDAMRFATLANLSALPMSGVHNVRGLKLIKELQDFNSNLYQDPGVVMEKLDTESDAMGTAIEAVDKAHLTKPGFSATTGTATTPTAGAGAGGNDNSNPLGLNIKK